MNFFSILSVGVAVVNVSLLDAFSFPRATLLNKSSTKLRCSTKEQYECKIHDSAPLLPNFNDSIKIIQKGIATIALTAAITAATATTSVATANELIDLDASSSLPTGEDTVELVLQNLKDATGDTGKSFKVFETVNEIITEGKGVGGSLSYPGVKLDRGYVEDEDTTVYNPGLSLLTETEKTSIVNGLIQNRKGNIASKTWSEDNQYAFEALKMRLDPLHMAELEGYLKVLPFLGGAMYLVALAAQQFARGIFEVAYVVSALVVFIPIFVLVAAGV